MDIYTPYFMWDAPVSTTVQQSIACEPDQTYLIKFSISIVSAYPNGNPQSVVIGSTAVASGAGSSLAWRDISYSLTCSAAASSNLIQFRLQSNVAREAHMFVDNVRATLLE